MTQQPQSGATARRRITWNETLTRGSTEAGHLVAILRTRKKVAIAAVKMPPGGTITEIYGSAFDEADARAQAEELVNWPTR
jgi:hypothetical protein